jgi:pimeloyl-ACP methyl ester carboxylesterase
MGELIPGSKVVILPDAGHTAHLEQTAAFERAVLGFFAQLSGGNADEQME